MLINEQFQKVQQFLKDQDFIQMGHLMTGEILTNEEQKKIKQTINCVASLLTELEDKQEMLVNQRKINENMAKK